LSQDFSDVAGADARGVAQLALRERAFSFGEDLFDALLKPAMPVLEIVPPVVARPCACVAWSNSRHRTPPSAQAVRFVWSTLIAFISDRSITTPPLFVP
jgi:hypothetical protein